MYYRDWGYPEIEEWKEDPNVRKKLYASDLWEFGLGCYPSDYCRPWSCWPRQDYWYDDHHDHHHHHHHNHHHHNHHQSFGCWPRRFCWPRQTCWPRGDCWPWKGCWPRQGCCPR